MRVEGGKNTWREGREEREGGGVISLISKYSPGSSAATGLVCALYALLRSILSAAVIWPLGFAAFSTLQVLSYYF